MDGTSATAAKPNLALRILRFPLTLLVLGFILFSLIAGPAEALGVLGGGPLRGPADLAVTVSI